MTDLGTRPDSRRRISLNGSGTRPKDTGEADEHHESRAERRRRRGAETRRETKPISLWVFFSITFGMSWGLGALAVVFQEQIEALTGPIGLTNPLFMLVVYSPAIAGIGLVWRHYGREGLRRYFRRLLMWRMPRSWWVYLVLGMPAVFYLGAVIKGESFDPFPFSNWYAVFPALGLTMILGPMEEFGWRGVALPLLQQKMAPIWAGLLLGTLWATWHLPAFLLEGTPQSEWSFAAFFVGLVAVELTLTPMFDAARGSLLIPMLYHFQLNGPIWPDAQPIDSFIFIAVAVIVVVLNRRKMFSRGHAPTELIAPDVPQVAPRRTRIRQFVVGLLVFVLAACGVGFASPPDSSVDLGVVLVEEHPCGYGFTLGSRDQVYGLFVESSDFASGAAGQLVEPMSLVDGRWSAEVRVGAHLFANWCDDVIEPGEPEPVTYEHWPVTSGTILVEELPPPGQCGTARATLSDLVIDTGDGLIELPSLPVSNPAWGCFAG